MRVEITYFFEREKALKKYAKRIKEEVKVLPVKCEVATDIGKYGPQTRFVLEADEIPLRKSLQYIFDHHYRLPAMIDGDAEACQIATELCMKRVEVEIQKEAILASSWQSWLEKGSLT